MPPPSPNPAHPEIKVTSNLRNGVTGRSNKPGKLKTSHHIHVRPAPTSPSSDITTPTTTPLQDPATIRALPDLASDASASDEIVSKGKRTALLSKSLPDAHARAASRKASAEEKERAQADRLAKKAAQQAKRDAEKSKKAQDDKEARMTPSEYASILQEKWMTRVANTPPEKLFLKDKVIFLVFEEQHKSHKDTRVKLDIVSIISVAYDKLSNHKRSDCKEWRSGCSEIRPQSRHPHHPGRKFHHSEENTARARTEVSFRDPARDLDGELGLDCQWPYGKNYAPVPRASGVTPRRPQQ